MKKRKEELVLNGSDLGTEELSEDVQELLRYRDPGTDEVRKVSDIQGDTIQGMAKVCKEGETENEDMPTWTKKAIGKTWARGAYGRRSKGCVHKEHHVARRSFFFLGTW